MKLLVNGEVQEIDSAAHYQASPGDCVGYGDYEIEFYHCLDTTLLEMLAVLKGLERADSCRETSGWTSGNDYDGPALR